MQLIDDWKKAYRLHSVQVSGVGAVVGALAAGMAASGAFAPWFGVLPTWMVWAGGALICAGTVFARLVKQ